MPFRARHAVAGPPRRRRDRPGFLRAGDRGGARAGSAEAGLAARFVHSNVCATRPPRSPETFDVVYTSWGAICWLHDIRRWTAIIAQFLAPGGFFYIAEPHPSALPLEQEDGRLYWHYPWRSTPDDPVGYDAPTTYTGDDTVFKNARAYNWNHPLSDIVLWLRRP